MINLQIIKWTFIDSWGAYEFEKSGIYNEVQKNHGREGYHPRITRNIRWIEVTINRIENVWNESKFLIGIYF